MELLGERPAWSMNGSEALSSIDSIDAEIARLEAARLPYIARVVETGHAEELGARNTAELLAFRYRMDPRKAHSTVRLALALPKYAAVTDALPDPAVPVPVPDGTDDTLPPEVLLRAEQMGVIVSMLEKVPATVPVESLRVAEEELVKLGRNMSPAELRKAAQRARDILDQDGPEPDEQKAAARERLTLIPDEHGVRISGYLANDNAELLCSTIHTGARPHRTIDGERDPRSAEKRRADALSGTLRIAAAATDADAIRATPNTPDATATQSAPPSADAPAASAEPTGPDRDAPDSVIADSTAADSVMPEPDSVTPGASAAVQAERCATDAATATLGPVVANNWVPGFGAKATVVVTIDWQDLKNATADCIGDTVYGAGLSASAARLLACDAKIIPVVLGSNSEPLDVGRCERLVTKGMRRALNTRDRGCVVCGAPPVQCDAHHLKSWIDGGVTAVSNLVLLCRLHHVDLHAGKWIVTIVDGKVHVGLPAWANPPSTKRRTPLRTTASADSSAGVAAATDPSSPTEPSPTEPSPTESGTSERGTSESGTSESGTSESGTSESGTSESGISERGVYRAGVDRAGVDRAGVCELGAAELGGNSGARPRPGGLGRPEAGRSGSEGWVLTAADIRAATLRAVWGEDLPSEPPRRLTRFTAGPDFDPRGEADTDPAATPPCVPR